MTHHRATRVQHPSRPSPSGDYCRIEMHLEFLPSIKHVLDKDDAIRTPAVTEPGMHRPRQEVSAFGPGSTPHDREVRSAAGMMPVVPQLAVEDLEFQDEAGRGGMGVVRKAVYRKGAEVAVKELLPTLAKSDYDLFVREMQLHFSIPPFPHIVPVSPTLVRVMRERKPYQTSEHPLFGTIMTLLDVI